MIYVKVNIDKNTENSMIYDPLQMGVNVVIPTIRSCEVELRHGTIDDCVCQTSQAKHLYAYHVGVMVKSALIPC